MVEPAPDTPPPARPRTTLRDLIGAFVVLLLVIAAVLGFGRGCSFSPGGPTVDPGSAPTVDASRELTGAASRVDFPVRRPRLPADWRANSSSTAALGSGAHVVVRVGWLTPSGKFVQLSQSSGDVGDVVAAETGTDSGRAAGTVDVNGLRWADYPGRRDERAWVTSLGGVTVLITGSAGEEEFRLLASETQAAEVLPRG